MALDNVSFQIDEGRIVGLIGPNGSGKTTLLQIVAGLRRPTEGSVSVLGRDAGGLTYVDRMSIGYIAEGQRLPGGMTLARLEAYLAPLYDGWDGRLADALRARFRLDPDRRLGTLSRGESMKAALLCTLAPRPELLVMDEPFTGMDVQVRDELVRGLLETSGRESWTVLVCSHDVGELDERGHLTITDRKKDVIITAGGKNISPSEIENSLKTSPFVKEAMVIGEGRKYLTALIGIELDTVGEWAQRRQLGYSTYRDLSAKPEVVELVSEVVDAVNANLAQVERIKVFRLLPKELDHEDGELTATQKVKRSAIEKSFSDLVESMYSGSGR